MIKVSKVSEILQALPMFSLSLNKLLLLVCLFMGLYFAYGRYSFHTDEQKEASVLILSPQVNDIYFLDFRLLNDKLERKNKYKLAKIVRVTDNNIAIVYGRFFYQWQYSVMNSIQHGDLSNDDYFMSIPEYISFKEIQEMKKSGAIYLVKRPVKNKVYGNFVSL